jgi:PAS domain S-box-containing protein
LWKDTKLTRIKVLLIEDDQSYYSLITKMLARETQLYEVEWASTYEEALTAIRQSVHDVYLVDYRLGNENGLELINELTTHNIHAPFILMTGQNERGLDMRVLKAGVADYLDKAELKPGVINRMIRYAIQRAKDLEALRASEESYRSLLEEASDGIFIVDSEGIIELVNSSACEIVRCSSESLIGQPLADFVVPPTAMINFLQSDELKTGKAVMTEFNFKKSDGKLVPVEISAKQFRPGWFQCIGRDITRRKEAEAEREKYIQRLTILQEIDSELNQSLSIGNVISLTLDSVMRLSGADAGYIGLVENVNIRIEHAIGRYSSIQPGHYLPRSDLLHQVIDEQNAQLLLDVENQRSLTGATAESRAQMLVPLVSYKRALGIINLETTRVDRFTQDSFDFIKLIASRAATAIENAQLYQISQDQLAQVNKLFNQVSDLEQLKTDMIRIAAHDLRNPVGIMVGYLELLEWSLGEGITERQKTQLDAMTRAAYRMEKITTDILSLERIEKMHLESALEFELNKLVEEIFHDYEAQAHSKRQTIEMDFTKEPLDIRGDPAQIREAASNLIGNAIKYTPEDGKIIVRLKREKLEAVFEVEDTGYGIPEDQQPNLFQPFYRASTEETAHTEGTGLGLHLVKNIITRHGGKMIFHSVYGKGSTFGFRLSLV